MAATINGILYQKSFVVIFQPFIFIVSSHPRSKRRFIQSWMAHGVYPGARGLQTRTTGRRVRRVVQQPCTDRSLISQIDTLT